MTKLENKYLSTAVGTSMFQLGEVNIVFVRAFIMGRIIGEKRRDLTKEEKDWINSITKAKYDLI